MSNEFYNPSGSPTQGSTVASPNIRSEFSSIAAGFDKLPALTGNAYKIIYVNAAGSALDVVGGSGLLKLSTTGVPSIATAGVDYQAWSANLDEYAAVNPTAAGLALLDDADATAQRTTLGLGTLATQNGTFSGTSSGTNTGDQTIALTGGVTGSGTGSFAATVVTNANLTGHVTSVGNAAVLGSFTVAQLSAAISDANISGTNTGDQTIALTGDVTGSGTGSFAATIANDSVTYGKMQNVSATDKLLGRSTAGAGDVEEIACTAAGRALLDDADAAAQRTTLGLVIGTNVQAYDTDLTTWAGVTPGTGVATALAVAVGSAGAPVVNGGALGTPSSGVATNLTGTAANLTSGITNALRSATTTVNVSSATAPSSGQVLTATSDSAATWQTPTASGISADIGAGGVGMMGMMVLTSGSVASGATVAGSSLRDMIASSTSGAVTFGASARTGTWRNISGVTITAAGADSGMFQRIS